jgi:hypothetical protein
MGRMKGAWKEGGWRRRKERVGREKMQWKGKRKSEKGERRKER